MSFNLSDSMPSNLFDWNNGLSDEMGYSTPSNASSGDSPFLGGGSSGDLLSTAAPIGMEVLGSSLGIPGLGTALSVGVGGILGHLSDKYRQNQANKLAEQEQKYALQRLAMQMAMEKELAGAQIAAQKEIAGEQNLNAAYSNASDNTIAGAQVGNSAIGNFLRAIGR